MKRDQSKQLATFDILGVMVLLIVKKTTGYNEF